eukprot:TRINITY_DN9543_c0_g1_i1.p1 TRINITY_DN9543_c0_g1~~TRINITY_DN9543_c0_g1_i1.p1  ORF type:complete len:181 (-),score=21.56 TRINITY_DN9543_c0_g1_i1:502-1044(-)
MCIRDRSTWGLFRIVTYPFNQEHTRMIPMKMIENYFQPKEAQDLAMSFNLDFFANLFQNSYLSTGIKVYRVVSETFGLSELVKYDTIKRFLFYFLRLSISSMFQILKYLKHKIADEQIYDRLVVIWRQKVDADSVDHSQCERVVSPRIENKIVDEFVVNPLMHGRKIITFEYYAIALGFI